MKSLKVLLIGQPNVGKSSLLNALVGSKVVVSNYPGTTVDITQAEKIIDGTKVKIIDTPGIYSISDRSREEKITEKVLFGGRVDGAVIIADASSLERSIYLVLQIIEAEIPCLVALNFVEEAEKKGIYIDSRRLEEILGIPVIKINPIKKGGINDLLEPLKEIGKTEFFKVVYDDHIEKAINTISSQVKGNHLPKRFISIRILERDEDFYPYLEDNDILKEVKKYLIEHPKVEEDISITRYGTASFIVEKATEIVPIKPTKKLSIQEKIDTIFFHRVWGPVFTGLFFIAIFGFLLFLGNIIENVLMGLTEKLLLPLGLKEHSIIMMIVIQGLTGAAAGVSIALPYVFLFYLILGLLEDVGLLPRFVLNTEKFLKKLGLPGKAFIPLALGLGCTVPAIKSSRILSTDKHQFHTISLLSFIPCSSRMAIIMGIVGFYGGVMLSFSLLVTLFIAGLVWALTLKILIDIKEEPLLLELPPFRVPIVKNVFGKSWIRMKDFVYIVIPLLIVGGALYTVLDTFKVTDLFVKPLSFIPAWLGLPEKTIIPLAFGFLQKDLTGSMLISTLGREINSVLSPLQLYTLGLAASIGIPCIIALGMLLKELGAKKAFILLVSSIGYGILFSGLAWRVIALI